MSCENCLFIGQINAVGETITTDLANYNGNYTYASEPNGKNLGETTSIGQFLPNAFGLYDMHGNVWEWCEDDFYDNYKNAPTNGRAWLSGETSSMKVRCGVSWFNHPVYCRSACRGDPSRGNRSGTIGFRVVRVV